MYHNFKRQTQIGPITLVIRPPWPNSDRKKFVSGFANSTPCLFKAQFESCLKFAASALQKMFFFNFNEGQMLVCVNQNLYPVTKLFWRIFYGDIFEVETDQNLAKVGSKNWQFQQNFLLL